MSRASVIIPTSNGEEFTEDCLESVKLTDEIIVEGVLLRRID